MMTADMKKIVNLTVHRKKSLGLRHRFDTAHLALQMTGMLMRYFSPAVLVLTGSMHDRRPPE